MLCRQKRVFIRALCGHLLCLRTAGHLALLSPLPLHAECRGLEQATSQGVPQWRPRVSPQRRSGKLLNGVNNILGRSLLRTKRPHEALDEPPGATPVQILTVEDAAKLLEVL